MTVVSCGVPLSDNFTSLRSVHWIAAFLLIASCGNEPQQADESGTEQKTESGTQPLLVPKPSEHTGITFANHITEDAQHNYFNYQYMYNGGGVGIGDINNDGLSDIYLTGNQVGDKLYLNKGDLQFEDITANAVPGAGDGWHNGVTMADVNNDGLLDIYVCRSGHFNDPSTTSNLLYLNNGDLTFSEKAQEYGVADTSHSTQAAFFDMDRDGDLDLYVMNVPYEGQKTTSNFEKMRAVRQRSAPTDRLYRNDGGHFNDVTYDVRIGNYGYGLGLSIADMDQDEWPDVYVANDYDQADMLYINQQGTGFGEQLKGRLRHISNFGMGCDVADFNNDALPDIMVLDMVSEEHVRSKENMASMDADRFWQMVRGGYHFQYMVNTLQLNNGNGTFSEIAQLAGVARTDWSWAPLFADLDNDGWKDLLVTNGFKRDMRNKDFVDQYESYVTNTAQQKFEEIISLVPANRVKNYLYRNNGDLTFSKVTAEWGFDQAINSNGAAYADLDNDGDLDVVINNIDARASVYENTVDTRSNVNFFRVSCAQNMSAMSLGAKAYLFCDGMTQYQELYPARGYQSFVEPMLHFGLGESTIVDSLIVIWPNGSMTRRTALEANSTITLDPNEGQRTEWTFGPDHEPLFHQFEEEPFHVHQETIYDDFAREVLLPHKMSELGPGIAVADVNGDGLDDMFITGSHGHASGLWIQQQGGSFVPSRQPTWQEHADQEQLDALFFEADGDGDQDLIVSSGSNEFDVRGEIFTHHFYRNTGAGIFKHDPNALPHMQTSAQRMAANDVDGDGDIDLFIAGRQTPGHYPFPPRSYLLLNDGSGKFADLTRQVGDKDLMGPGMVTGCAFADMDGDQDLDLITLGEWMAITIFLNEEEGLVKAVDNGLDGTHGWWSALAIADVDKDGDQDIIGGNFGWNSKFQATLDRPQHIYYADFDDSGRSDIVLAKEKQGKKLPVRGRQCSSEQCPSIAQKFNTFEKFAHASLEEIYGEEKLENALHYQATFMRSTVFLNDGDGDFTSMVLPNIAQIAPINAIVPYDVNDDGHLDLICTGNNWGAEVETVRYDAGNGLVLLGDGSGNFNPLTIAESGFFTPGNARDMAVVNTANGPMIMVANNQGPVQQFLLQKDINGHVSR